MAHRCVRKPTQVLQMECANYENHIRIHGCLSRFDRIHCLQVRGRLSDDLQDSAQESQGRRCLYFYRENTICEESEGAIRLLSFRVRRLEGNGRLYISKEYHESTRRKRGLLRDFACSEM